MEIQEQQRLIQEKWLLIKDKYKIGDKITGIIIKHQSYGLFVDIGELPIWGFIRIPNVTDEPANFKIDLPYIGEKILGVVVEISEIEKQINIPLRASHLKKYP